MKEGRRREERGHPPRARTHRQPNTIPTHRRERGSSAPAHRGLGDQSHRQRDRGPAPGQNGPVTRVSRDQGKMGNIENPATEEDAGTYARM